MGKCERCVYRARPGADNQCDYLIITGHSRGCPAGEDCTVFQPGERLGKPKSLPIKSQKKVTEMPKGKRVEIDSDRALNLVAEGLTDLQIAERLGIGLSTWRNYKRRNGWTDPVNNKIGRARNAPPAEQEEAPEPTFPPETLVEEVPPPPSGPVIMEVHLKGYRIRVEADSVGDAMAGLEDVKWMMERIPRRV